jgi:hypothetical protein
MPAARPHHTPRPLATWLVVWALVLGALAPTLAQALVDRHSPDQWVEICQSSGMVWIKADGGTPDPDGTHPLVDATQHCGWCQVPSGALGTPPRPWVWWGAPSHHPTPLATPTTRSIGTGWTPLQARAPPRHS